MFNDVYAYLSWPWALLALPLPYFVQRFIPEQKQGARHALHVPFFENIQTLSHHNASLPPLNQWLLWLMWFFLIISLSGPQWVGEPQPQQKEGRNIMLALDLSGSMEQMDMQINQRPVTRLEVVKVAATSFIKKRQGDRIGLILFGSNAYLQTPLTFDRITVEHMLDDATIGLAGQTTSIGDAIALSVKRLKETPKKSRVLVLLTDGSNNSGNIEPIKAAEIAKKYHIKMYTIGLGAEQQVMNGIFGPQIYNPSQDLDEVLLKKMAHLTGGNYFRAKDSQQLSAIYQQINELEPVEINAEQFRPVHLYYHIPLAMAFCCFLLFGFLPLGSQFVVTRLRKQHA